jgi:hypothetical protein
LLYLHVNPNFLGWHGQQRVNTLRQKEKPHSLLRNCGVYLVAWGRIELPTRGFSTHLSKLKTVFAQAFVA